MTASTRRHLRIGLAAAVLAAAGWAAQAQQNPAPQERERPDTRSLRREMARDLFNITPEQEKKLQELREAGRKDRQAWRGEMRKMRGEMRDLMRAPQANTARIDKLIDSRARLRAEREKAAFRSREDRRSVFTPEQLEKMKKYRGLVRERFGAAGGPGADLGRPGMARHYGRGAARAWRMGPGVWRHPYARWDW
jgi:Spy/CpxP family protein refolding chaperone